MCLRRGRVWLLAGLLLLMARLVSAATADNPSPATRLDPALRHLLRQRQAQGPAAIQTLGGPTVDVTIRAEHDVSRVITALGGRVHSVTGAGPIVITARFPIQRLERLARVPGIIAISASAPTTPALDRSVVDIQADQVWTLRHGGLPITGHGVIIGIVDTGIDWQHPDFKDGRDRSRIVAIWDQTVDGRPPAGFDYGTEWQRWQIEAGLASETDSLGHGTHVAGIAAGGGHADRRYTGVAPDAQLIVVKSPLDTAHIIDAWHYIINRARAMGRPVVINNSFGAHFGPHDGTTDYELALNALSGPGVIFTAAAGNEGGSDLHATGRVLADGPVTVGFRFTSGYPRTYADVNLWYDAGDSFSVSVTAPTGETFGPVVRGDLDIFVTADGTEIIIDAISAPWPANGDNWVKIRLDDQTALRGEWSFTLRGDRVVNGYFDAWLPYGPYDQAYFTSQASPYTTLREPGTATRAISVGAYVTKNCWWGMDKKRYCDQYVEGALYPSTSRGPTRDGRPKPDLAAPGFRVFAPRSGDAPLTDIWRVSPDGHYEGQPGTSVSTAHVTGVLALMLQVDPELDPATAREILQQAARTDAYTGPVWDPAWGAGKLDALAAIQAVQRRVAKRRYLPLITGDFRWQPTPTPTATRTPVATATPTSTATPILVPSPGRPTPLSVDPQATRTPAP